MVKCPVCGREFKSEKGMNTHLRQVQDVDHMKHPKSLYAPVKEVK